MSLRMWVFSMAAGGVLAFNAAGCSGPPVARVAPQEPPVPPAGTHRARSESLEPAASAQAAPRTDEMSARESTAVLTCNVKAP